MRFTAVALLLLTTPALGAGYCSTVKQPPKSAQREPTVYFDQYTIPTAELARMCGTGAKACTYPLPTPSHPDRWVIVIDDAAPLDDLACLVTYEKAHLPPNYWVDPKMEGPETTALFANLKRHHALTYRLDR